MLFAFALKFAQAFAVAHVFALVVDNDVADGTVAVAVAVATSTAVAVTSDINC